MSNLEEKSYRTKKSSKEELGFWYNRVIGSIEKNDENRKKLDFIKEYEKLSSEEYDLSPWEKVYKEFKKDLEKK